MDHTVEPQDFQAYVHEARSWETDKIDQLIRSRACAWRIAVVAAATAFAAVTAVALLTPLKRVEPFVIRVDRATGIVDIVSAMKDAPTTYDEAINRYFIQWYVRYREAYSPDLASEYYNNVGILSANAEQQKFQDSFNPKNPLSPLNVYGATARVRVRIKSTSFIQPTIALVRYTKEVERNGEQPLVTHWAATIIFKYSAAPMAEKDRAINPLGFQAIEYRTDPDTPIVETTAHTKATDAPAIVPSVTVFPGQRATTSTTSP